MLQATGPRSHFFLQWNWSHEIWVRDCSCNVEQEETFSKVAKHFRRLYCLVADLMFKSRHRDRAQCSQEDFSPPKREENLKLET